MSKVLGIIAEYNPFHNGHLYHLKKSKELTNADYTVAVISGNFTQRGSTSVIDKWSKAEMALNNGIDLVLELPVWYSISSAENFANGAVKLLSSLGIIDYLSFGSETSDIRLLKSIADILCDEPLEFKNILTNELKSGISFPKARENAVVNYFEGNYVSDDLNISSICNVLSSPNNILGIEYLKALKKCNSSISPVCVPRIEVGYNDINSSNNFASATAIRNLLKNDDFDAIKNLVPSKSYSILMDCVNSGNLITDLNCFEKEIFYVLRKMSINEIANLPDVSEGLEFNIKKASVFCNNLSELIDTLKSKRYALTRIQRILLYVLLGITKDDMELSKKCCPFARVLGFNDNGKKLISKIKLKNPNVPIITSVKKFLSSDFDDSLKNMLYADIFATNVYSLGFNNCKGNLDFTHKIIKK